MFGRKIHTYNVTTLVFGLFLLAIVVVLTPGCGGGGEDPAPAAAPAEPAPAPAPAPVAAEGEAEPAAINEDESNGEDNENEEAAEPDAVKMPEAIPPLDQWKDPFAASLKDLIGGQTAVGAIGVLADELAKSLDELSAAVKALDVDSDALGSQIEKINAAQMKTRKLVEVARFVGSLLSEEERNTVLNAAKGKFIPKLGQVSAAMQSKNLFRGVNELGELALSLNREYVDPLAELKSLIPEKPVRNSSDDYYDTSYDSSYADSYGGGSSSGAGLEKACTDFLAAYTPGGPADSKIESHLTKLISTGQVNLLGYNPRGTSGSSDGYYDSGSPSSSSSSARSTNRNTTKRTGELDFGDEPAAAASTTTTSRGPKRETIKDELRRAVAYALKDLLRDRSAKGAPKALIAYCAFTREDIVPEAYTFLKELPEGTLKDLECYNAIVIESEYGQDPRVQFLLCDMMKIGAGSSSLETKMYEIFNKAPGSAGFFAKDLQSQLGNPEALKATLTILNKIGNGDSALAVANLLASPELPATWHGAIIDILGNTGDERVAQALTKFLAKAEHREQAKTALIRIGSPVEKSVAAVLQSKKRFAPDAEKLALEILGRVGSWNSLRVLSARLVFYSEAKTAEELPKTETAVPAVQIEPTLRNEMIKLTIENGTAIISRLTGSESPDLQGKKTRSGSSSGTSSPDGYYDTTPDSGYYDSSSGSSARTRVDPDAPRELFGADSLDPGKAPLVWSQALASSCTIKADELARILGRAVSYESGKTAGEKAAAYSWVERYYALARAQVILFCQPKMDPALKKDVDSTLAKVETRLERVASEKKRIQRSARTAEGLREGLKAATPVAEGNNRSSDMF